MKTISLLTALCIVVAAQLASCQDDVETLIQRTGEKLGSGQAGITEILTDTSLMYLHPQTGFRELIRQYARAEKIRLTSDREPGTKITMKGSVTNKSGMPYSQKTVYVYQTDARGWYADSSAHVLMQEGDRRHARLFGYFKTDDKGQFEFETIQPQGYPKSDLPAHIHIEITAADQSMEITEMLFDDDPRLTKEARARAEREHFYISQNTGTKERPVYVYRIIIP